jgi:MoxR-like ATPase
MSDVERIERFAEVIDRVRQQIGKVIVGQHAIIEQLLIALFARGHCLLIGVPGLAKTLLIRTLAQTMALKFSRIQFTPDLMPGDITGTEVLEENLTTGEKHFRFVRGPIFANIVLADEINRTPPKTQSALLEAMQEHSVTVAGVTYPSGALLCAGNAESNRARGTYPLPEAQLDRFMFNLWMDYPSFEEEVEIVRTTTTEEEPQVEPVLTAPEILEYQRLVRRIPVSEHVIEYAVQLVRATRPQNGALPMVREYLRYGAGPRASQYLILGAKARAALYGRYTPTVEDVRAVTLPVLRHRMVLNFAAEADNVSAAMLVERLLDALG